MSGSVKKKSVTYWDVRVGEQIAISEDIKIRVESKSGQQTRIRIECPESASVGKVAPQMAAFAKRGITA